jgi:hypothetical protein
VEGSQKTHRLRTETAAHLGSQVYPMFLIHAQASLALSLSTLNTFPTLLPSSGLGTNVHGRLIKMKEKGSHPEQALDSYLLCLGHLPSMKLPERISCCKKQNDSLVWGPHSLPNCPTAGGDQVGRKGLWWELPH